jgi:hypothetical protein
VVADFTRNEVPEEFTMDLKVVVFPQLGYLVEIAMENADIGKIPLDYQVDKMSTLLHFC